MGSQVLPAKDVDPVSNSEPRPEESDMEARVSAMWEQMNKGASNQTIKPFSNKRSASMMHSTSHKMNANWMTYLGLAPKETAHAAQDAQQDGPSGTQNGISDEDKKVAAMWEQMNKGISTKTLKSLSNKSDSTVDKTLRKKSDNWMAYLGLASNRTESLGHDDPQMRLSVENGTSDEAKKLAAAALTAVKHAAAATLGSGKVEMTEVRDFAGQEIEVRKFVDAESKEAAERAKASAPSAVDSVLEQIKKKQKLSVLDKTKKDWGEFKEENKGLEDELDAYKKSSNQYLDKVSFLQRADYREFERERDARLAVQARRRPDMREEP